MPIDPNPYQAPKSSLDNREGLLTPVQKESLAAAARYLSTMAIVSGVAFLLLPLTEPALLRWQLANALRPFGAESMLNQAVEIHMAHFQLQYMLGAGLCAAAIVAGGLLRRLQRSALHVLMAVCVMMIVFAMWRMLTAHGSALPVNILRGAWWTLILCLAVRTNRRFEP